jgi:hypothetical protein
MNYGNTIPQPRDGFFSFKSISGCFSESFFKKGNQVMRIQKKNRGNRSRQMATRLWGLMPLCLFCLSAAAWGFNFTSPVSITPVEELRKVSRYGKVAVDGNDNAYAVWEDYRNGQSDIYFSYRPSGGTWGPNIRVNDDAGPADHITPAIAVDPKGNAYAVWSDSRNGDKFRRNIYCSFRPAGPTTTWTANQKINDDPGTNFHDAPAIAVSSTGAAFVAWEDYRNGNRDIYFSCRSGDYWSKNERVNQDIGASDQRTPRIGVDSQGNAHAVWVDSRDKTPFIHVAYRPWNGSWGMDTRINQDSTAEQYTPDISVGTNNLAFVVWSDRRNGHYDIYSSARDPGTGQWNATPIKVNQDTNYDCKNPTVSAAGGLFAAWEDSRGIIGAIAAFGVWFEIGQAAASGFSPSLAVDNAGNNYLIWDVNSDINFSYWPMASLGPWAAPVTVSLGNNGTAIQFFPSIGTDKKGNAYAVWLDLRNGHNDFYFAYRPAGGPWGVNVKVNDEPGAVFNFPGLAVDPDGNAYAVWEDSRNGNSDIYFAYRPAGGSWGVNVKINDDLGVSVQKSPSITVDPDGNAYAVWYDFRSSSWDIYFSYRPAGKSWGPNVKVNDSLMGSPSRQTSIAVDGQGNAQAVWVDSRNGKEDIYSAYRPKGGTWGSNEKVSKGTLIQSKPVIAMDNQGNAYAVWDSFDNGYKIYFAYRPAGGSWGTNVKWNFGAYDDPYIGIDNLGAGYACWTGYAAGTAFSWCPAQGDCITPTNLEFYFRRPKISLDSSGNIHMVGEDYRFGGASIFYSFAPGNRLYLPLLLRN